MSDFERDEDRREHAEEQRESAELALMEVRSLVRSRCCLFLDDGEGEVLHGRLEGLMTEVDTFVLRDLRPGRERLQCRLQVPYGNVLYACHSGSQEKCFLCPEHEAMQRQAKRAGARKPARRAGA